MKSGRLMPEVLPDTRLFAQLIRMRIMRKFRSRLGFWKQAIHSLNHCQTKFTSKRSSILLYDSKEPIILFTPKLGQRKRKQKTFFSGKVFGYITLPISLPPGSKP
ncbi:hypothetical protein CEXT_417761 [Caerostris extrusa]|uniref:Ribosomal protein S19 n=1 Tax=Caerostris extrusa TaxID=172846 RepID=A0AAV4R0M7_CAEEX|nr:hypothetical protein CEXT_417761 [Caerostris extrusa]